MPFEFLIGRPRRRNLMHSMMRRLRIDRLPYAEAENGALYAESSDACAECDSKENCERWLDSTLLSSKAPGFCANAERFADFKEQPRRGR